MEANKDLIADLLKAQEYLTEIFAKLTYGIQDIEELREDIQDLQEFANYAAERLPYRE